MLKSNDTILLDSELYLALVEAFNAGYATARVGDLDVQKEAQLKADAIIRQLKDKSIDKLIKPQ